MPDVTLHLDLSPADQAQVAAILAGDEAARAALTGRVAAWHRARLSELDEWIGEATAWLASNEPGSAGDWCPMCQQHHEEGTPCPAGRGRRG